MEIESRRLKNLEDMAEPQISPEEDYDTLARREAERAQKNLQVEFRAQIEQERRVEAMEKHRSKELVNKMKSASGIEQKLDTIISVLADNSGKLNEMTVPDFKM